MRVFLASGRVASILLLLTRCDLAAARKLLRSTCWNIRKRMRFVRRRRDSLRKCSGRSTALARTRFGTSRMAAMVCRSLIRWAMRI